MDNAVIIGCGDVGCRVGALLRARGTAVIGVTRFQAGCERIQAADLVPWRLDLDGELPRRLEPAHGALVFYFAPPPRTGDDDPRLEAFLRALGSRTRPARLVYISTSGVYGDCGGAWVDESQPLAPGTLRAKRRVAAEELLWNWSRERGVDLVVLRVPGIYGPGRLPVERLRRGLPVICDSQAPFSNRIHADDLAAAALLVADRTAAGGVYNVADGHPTTMTDYFNRVADLMELPRPRQISLEEARKQLSPAMLSFLNESRRLDCRRLFADLGFVARYPDLATGLPSCVA